MKILLINVLTLFVALLVVSGDAFAQSASESQAWTGASVRKSLGKKARLELEQQARFGSEQGYAKTFTEIGGRYKLSKHVRIGASYRFTSAREKGLGHRGSASVQLRHKIGDVRLSYRSKYQHSAIDSRSKSVFRNRASVSRKFGEHVVPYVASEVHYLLQNSEFREFRALAGASVKLSKDTGLCAFYMWQYEFNKRVEEKNHIFGVGLMHSL